MQDGDILIQRGNTLEYVGVSAIYRGETKEFIYPDLMMKIQTNEKAEIEFIHYALSYDQTREYFRQNATGTAGNMPKINQTTVMNAPIFIPPKEEQQEIIRLAETLFEYIDQIETRYQQASGSVERITQSVLGKAFRGELVPQDPNDEPASVLLERIRAERVTLPQKEKKKRVKNITIAASTSPLEFTGGSTVIMTKLEFKDLVEVLKAQSKPMSPEALLREAGYKVENIEKFYEELKKAVDANHIEELRPTAEQVLLSVK